MRRLAAGLLLAALLTACAAPDGTQLTVFAAASLGEAFEELAARFEEDRPGVEVVLNLAGSQRLAAQVLDHAPADVLATADQQQLARVTAAGHVAGEPAVFARNELVIAVEPGNPDAIRGLADLARPGLVVVLAAEEVPAGHYAREALAAAGVDVSPASLEADVRAVRTKVALGEADAGIVYRTDVAAAAGAVDGVPVADSPVATYPIAVLAGSEVPELAEAFVALVRSPTGRSVLSRHGFSAP